MLEDIAARLRAWSDDLDDCDYDPRASTLPSQIFALSSDKQVELAATVEVPLADYLSRIAERGTTEHAGKALHLLRQLSNSRLPVWGYATAYWFFYEPTPAGAARIAEVIGGGKGMLGYWGCVSAVKQMAVELGDRRAIALGARRAAQKLPAFDPDDFFGMEFNGA